METESWMTWSGRIFLGAVTKYDLCGGKGRNVHIGMWNTVTIVRGSSPSFRPSNVNIPFLIPVHHTGQSGQLNKLDTLANIDRIVVSGDPHRKMYVIRCITYAVLTPHPA